MSKNSTKQRIEVLTSWFSWVSKLKTYKKK